MSSNARSARLLILGGGPAGLAAAIAAGSQALVLERNADVGRKLLLSGNGQCNFTNSLAPEAWLARCGKYARFLKPAYYCLDNQELIRKLDQAGCPSLARPDGKVFPASMRAGDVRSALQKLALQAEARILCGARIVRITKAERFRVEDAEGQRFEGDRLLVAVGGCSYPQTGSDGSLFRLLQDLGHSIVEPGPALAAVDIADFGIWRACAGVSLKEVEATFHTQAGVFRAQGDLLWTHTGLSGPLILDNSYRLDSGDRITLHLVRRAESRIPELLGLAPRQSLLQALRRFAIPESLLRALLISGGIDPGLRCGDVGKITRNACAGLLAGLNFTVRSVESLSTAMATRGGIPLAEVRARDLESKVIPGLHFAGEVLDYNLPTGGFNIQAACSTGYLAGLVALRIGRKKT